jgi:TetR/AcrR family transcriptional regulator
MDNFPSLDQTAASLIPALEKEKLVTRTFRRLDAERQLAVIEATFGEASESGPDHIHIKEVANRSGVAVGSLYQYFGSKDGLNKFAARLGAAVLQALFRISRTMLLRMPAMDALRAYLSEGVNYFQGQDAYLRFFARAAYSGDSVLAESVVDPIADDMLSTVRAIIQKGMESGEFRKDLDLEATARAVHILLTATGDGLLLPYLNRYFRCTDSRMPRDRLLAALFALLDHGMASPIKKTSTARKA